MYPVEKRQQEEADFFQAVKNLRERTIAISKTEDVEMSMLPPKEPKVKPLVKKTTRAPQPTPAITGQPKYSVIKTSNNRMQT